MNSDAICSQLIYTLLSKGKHALALQAIQIQPQMYNIAADNNVSIQNIFSEIASFVYLMMMPFFYLYL